MDTNELSDRLIELNAAFQNQTPQIKILNNALEDQKKEIEKMATSVAQILDVLRRHDSAGELLPIDIGFLQTVELHFIHELFIKYH